MSQKEIVSRGFFTTTPSGRRKDFLAAAIILFYCVVNASLRFFISRSMELDEVEQFLDGSVFSFGYSNQAPLYTWIVYGISHIFGLNFPTLLFLKYFLLFLFYLVFFLTVRFFWDADRSLTVTASLLLFPTYSYDANRAMSHSVLVSLMAVTICFFYVRLALTRKTLYYCLIGIVVGLGLLAKYNFVFFLGAIILSILTSKEDRQLLFDRRISLSVFCCLLVLLPHLLWLAQGNLSSIHYALKRSGAGAVRPDSFLKTISLFFFTNLEVIVFSLIFFLIFYRRISLRQCGGDRMTQIFKRLAFFGLMIPISLVLLLRMHNFPSRWLSPVIFAVPIALFSLIPAEAGKKGGKLLGVLCILVALSILAARAFVGFSPDITGKAERLHIPWDRLSRQLIVKLEEGGIHNLRHLSVIVSEGDQSTTANLMALIPSARFVSLNKALSLSPVRSDIEKNGGIFVCPFSECAPHVDRKIVVAFPSSLPMETIRAPFLHSTTLPPYSLRIVVIPKDLKRT